jgi:arylsulfate sulfotransferase
VVWYTGIPSNYDVRQLANGNLLFPFEKYFAEVNMLGETLETWPLPDEWPYHHEAFPTAHGTFLYLSTESRWIEDFPTNATDPNPPRERTLIHHRPVLELSRTTGEIINQWSPIDLMDPRRVGYLSFIGYSPIIGWDWSHSNGVIEDPRDGGIIVSIRHLNVVMKFTRAGELKWILGPHENWTEEFQPFLLTPVGTPFEWQYAQHAPMITPQGTLLLFDNGNHRASPPDPPVPDHENYSRAVEYHINEETMEVTQVWEYGGNLPERLYSGSRGDADWLSVRGNVLITFADISFINGVRPGRFSERASMTRIIEVTRDEIPEVVFDIALFDDENRSSDYRGVTSYRARRIPDLYPISVGAMSPASGDKGMTVVWNAVPDYTYRLFTSGDLIAWEPLETIVATNATMTAELELLGANQFIRVERAHALQ